MKKGFTLVELIAVLVILGLVSLITIPIVNNNLKKYRNDLYMDAIQNIEQAAKNWGADNIGKLPNTVAANDGNDTIMAYPDIDTEAEFSIVQIRVKDLQAGGYISPELKNPKKNYNFCNCAVVTIKRTAVGLEYKILDNTEGLDLLVTNPDGCIC